MSSKVSLSRFKTAALSILIVVSSFLADEGLAKPSNDGPIDNEKSLCEDFAVTLGGVSRHVPHASIDWDEKNPGIYIECENWVAGIHDMSDPGPAVSVVLGRNVMDGEIGLPLGLRMGAKLIAGGLAFYPQGYDVLPGEGELPIVPALLPSFRIGHKKLPFEIQAAVAPNFHQRFDAKLFGQNLPGIIAAFGVRIPFKSGDEPSPN